MRSINTAPDSEMLFQSEGCKSSPHRTDIGLYAAKNVPLRCK